MPPSVPSAPASVRIRGAGRGSPRPAAGARRGAGRAGGASPNLGEGRRDARGRGSSPAPSCPGGNRCVPRGAGGCLTVRATAADAGDRLPSGRGELAGGSVLLALAGLERLGRRAAMQVRRSAGDEGAARNRTTAAGEAASVVLERTGRPGFATRAGVDRFLGGEGGAGAWASASGAMRSERRKPRGRWDGFMSRGSAPRPRSQGALHVVERVRDRSPKCGGSRARGRRVPQRVREARAWMPLGFEASRRSRGASRFSRRRGRVLREGGRARGRRDVGWSRLVRRPHCDSGDGGSPLGCRGPRHSGGGRGHAARGAKRAPGSRGPIAPAARPPFQASSRGRVLGPQRARCPVGSRSGWCDAL